ncbi:hypothetical protein N7474_010304 [Penicillium riverlandense]|uniref:uncharacterized protein n=1 Tax=Penicillium riverlandense TaxID=1903569 RepID=UPI0025495574|nr:uncharacterized protein N7474_010304 [Penicillium riverlandense]KAJ5806712.1 hypothetical protein N7474_010304 [Penicillium riverlandense]
MLLIGALSLALAAVVNAQGQGVDPLLPENSPGSDCPLAGPAFPAPAHLSNSTLFHDAILEFEAQLTNRSLGLEGNDTAWAIAVFSAKENRTVYERYYTPPINVSVKEVNEDSVFRLASASKVFTVWAFLKELGDSRFNDPITKYVPELANKSYHTDTVYDDIEDVRWEEVTLGELASQSAGIARDVNLDDLSVNYPTADLVALGFPELKESAFPLCDGNLTQPPCTRKQFFDLLFQKTPIWPSSHSPAYSNIAFNLLGYALESITGKSLEETMTKSIFGALNMSQSSFIKPPTSGGVIPGDLLTSGWARDIGSDNAGGGVYMSTRDFVKAGQAILQSTLLPPAQTRRWLQPRIQTGYLGAAVGAPWEITFLESSNNRLVQYYTKDGDLNAYHSSVVLSPEHQIGFTVLAAGTADSNAAVIRSLLKVNIGEILMPAVEEQAKEEASVTFNGTYIDDATNSSVVIAAGYKGHTGLTVRSLTSNGVPMMGPGTSPDGLLASGLSIGNTTRLYPTTLKTVSKRSNGRGTYDSRLGFRASFHPEIVNNTVLDPCILDWANLDGITYGRQGFDDWVFDISEDGKATGVNIRLLRLKLKKL